MSSNRQPESSSVTSSQRKIRAASSKTPPAPGNSGAITAFTNERRTTGSTTRKNSAETSNLEVRIPTAQTIAARATAADDNDDLRRTIASRNLKRKAEDQVPAGDHKPAKRTAKAEPHYDPQQTSRKKRRKQPANPHVYCSCVHHLRLELAKAKEAFQDQEHQISNLDAEAERYERQILQKDDYIQRLLQRLESTKKPVLCTADWDLLELTDASNRALLKRHEEWRKDSEARTLYEIVKPVDVALKGECEELRRRLKLAEEKLQLLEQERGAPWQGQDADQGA